MPIIRRKLLYLCDTDVCHSIWMASGLLLDWNLTSRPDATHREWQTPVSHRYSNFLLMMGTWMPKTCREVKYVKQNCAPSWTYLEDEMGYPRLLGCCSASTGKKRTDAWRFCPFICRVNQSMKNFCGLLATEVPATWYRRLWSSTTPLSEPQTLHIGASCPYFIAIGCK